MCDDDHLAVSCVVDVIDDCAFHGLLAISKYPPLHGQPDLDIGSNDSIDVMIDLADPLCVVLPGPLCLHSLHHSLGDLA